MKVLFVDAYDSFTWNLVQVFQALGQQVEVMMCDQIEPAEIKAARPDRLVFGPGPGHPGDYTKTLQSIQLLASEIPILGVCLGHQAIGMAFGARVIRHLPVHGHATPIHHDGTGVFVQLDPKPAMTRYHSLVLDRTSLPDCLAVNAISDGDAVMAIRHRTLPIHGVQFHPESVLSGTAGLRLLENFLTHPWTVESAPDSLAPAA